MGNLDSRHGRHTLARIQILELPMQHVGEFSHTPFVLVFDRVEDEEFADDDVSTLGNQIRANADLLKSETGARGVLVLTDDIEVG